MTKNFHFPKPEKEKPSCMCIYQKKLPLYVYVSTNSNQQLSISKCSNFFYFLLVNIKEKRTGWAQPIYCWRPKFASGPNLDFPMSLSLMEFSFSKIRPALNLAMKLSAFVSTSGLGQNILAGDIPASVTANGLAPPLGVSSPPSKSGEPLLELLSLLILTKSPCLTNLQS